MWLKGGTLLVSPKSECTSARQHNLVAEILVHLLCLTYIPRWQLLVYLFSGEKCQAFIYNDSVIESGFIHNAVFTVMFS